MTSVPLEQLRVVALHVVPPVAHERHRGVRHIAGRKQQQPCAQDADIGLKFRGVPYFLRCRVQLDARWRLARVDRSSAVRLDKEDVTHGLRVQLPPRLIQLVTSRERRRGGTYGADGGRAPVGPPRGQEEAATSIGWRQ